MNRMDQLETFTAYYPNSAESENERVEKLSKDWKFKNYSLEITPNFLFRVTF